MARTATKEEEILMNKTLSSLLTKSYELEATLTEDSELRCQQLLLPRLEEFMKEIKQFKQCTSAYKHIQVPTDVLRFIDEGGHPDDFVRNLFVTGVVDTQLAAGKVAAVKAMRESLAAAAGGAYPEAATAYRQAVESKQQQHQQPKQQQTQQVGQQQPE